jgi:hypothetical protein
MKKFGFHVGIVASVFGCLLSGINSAQADEKPISFTRSVRPILVKNCFACHGPDASKREADLRLDHREVAVNSMAISPGRPDKSKLIARIASNDPDVRMPPPEMGAALSKADQDILRRWISGGAKYDRHWSFDAPKQSDLPSTRKNDWVRNEIDAFVLARLRTEQLEPARAADSYALVRRVYLDLIGLPPTPAQADEFVNDRNPQAYERLVDRLLASQEYGEHWARRWLDLARYADTNGYEKDRARSIWPYRDWVIDAVNDDMPFDQFSIEQLAGDMLPNATASQRIATGFHRNTMINEEGGIDPLEFRFYAIVDRVATTGTVWLGLTTGCAQCHSHKYDPISHTDYYGLMAFLNNADEPDFIFRDPDVQARRRLVEDKIKKLENALAKKFPPAIRQGSNVERRQRNLESKFNKWLATSRKSAVEWQTLKPLELKTNLPRLEVMKDGSIFSTGDITKRDEFALSFSLAQIRGPITALRLEVLPDYRLPAQGPGRAYYEGRKGDFFLSELKANANNKAITFSSGSHDYGKIAVGSGNTNASNVFDGEGSTGWSTAEREGQAHQLVLNFAKPVVANGELKIEMLFERHFAASLGRFRISVASSKTAAQAKQMPVRIESLLTRANAALGDQERNELKNYFLSVAPELAGPRKEIEALRKQLPAFPTTMVLRKRPRDNPRPTFRHHRGEFLSPKEKVSPAIPSFLPPLPPGATPNRLAFAKWLVSDRNPLVGRVTVNRAWQAFFGRGLVPTPAEFGTQGDSPTHPKLLDWLAVAFTTPVEKGGLGWSRKRLHRFIVMSATYRQSSHITPAALVRDRENELLARGPRFRVDAETVRDILLSASGLLTQRVGGPSVYPPQPAGVTALAYGNTKWPVSKGADRYRRSLYTFRKRTAPFAAYTVFDAPTAENCIVLRGRSNTPLQSLTLLNDAMFLELAKQIATNAVQAEKTPAARATFIFRSLLTRPPRETELDKLVKFESLQQSRLEQGELNAATILGKNGEPPELAAWFLVARALMNLDETITKP